MDRPWYAMNPREQQRMRGLSIDLYALREGGPKRVEMSAAEELEWRKAAKVALSGYKLGDVDAALDFLRNPIPAVIPAHMILNLRAMAWDRLGDLDTALVFLKEAERLDPKYTVSFLTLLNQAGRMEEARDYAEKIIGRDQAAAEELYFAVAVLAPTPEAASSDQAAPVLRRIISILRRASVAFDRVPPEARLFPDLDASIAYTLGLCQERLGETGAALLTYSAALALHPKHADLLVARGLTRYTQDRQAAMADFVAASQANASSIWPWYILARHALEMGNYGDALRYALRASERTGPNQILAEAFETIAISYAMMAQPHEWVLENLTKAASLDPSNQRIRENREIAVNLVPKTRTRWKTAPPGISFPIGAMQSSQQETMIRQAREVKDHQSFQQARAMEMAG